MRRRLWWQILIMDSRAAQLAGADMFWDTKRPLNVNDSDLSSALREFPAEHDGVTEMLICSMRSEVGQCIRQLKHLQKNMSTGEGSIAQQDRAVDDLEHRLENRF
jgi:hypothetical protein